MANSSFGNIDRHDTDILIIGSGGEILGRTQGSAFWAIFYALFVFAVSVHAAIGVRTVLFEWLKIRGSVLELLSWGLGLGLLVMGLYSVYAVTA